MTQAHPIYPLSDEIVDALASHRPTEATYLGIRGHDDRMPDLSPEGAEETLVMLDGFSTRLDELPPAADKWDRLAVEVARSVLDEETDHLRRGDHLMNLNPIASPAQDLREVFDHMSRDEPASWEDIIARLRAMDSALDGYRQSLNEGRRRGLLAAQRQAEAVARQAGIHASSEDSAFLQLEREFESMGHSRALGNDLAGAVTSARAAFGRLSEYLREDYLPSARPKDGVGAEEYTRHAARFLGTEIDPRSTYEWGWSEVASIRRRMESISDEILPGGGVAGALDVLKTDPDRSAPDRDTFRSMMQDRIDEALGKLAGSHFDVPEQIRTCVVKIAPPGGSLGAYYVGPSEDFSRPGGVWWSLEGDGPLPLYDEVSTAYHEGFPGHHLQVGVQVSLADKLSRLHRLWMWKPGVGEGWALYAERLMDELGYLDKPDYVFGYLAAQMLRACRVVIDIGAHLDLPIPENQPFHPGEPWRFDTATEMLREFATLEASYAESEVTRYLGWPGQAIAYKVGEQAILDIRREVREARGNQFDLEDFHRDLLEIGPVGLDLLREMMLT